MSMDRLRSSARSKRPTKCYRIRSAELPTIELSDHVTERQRHHSRATGPIGTGKPLATPTGRAAAKVGVRGHRTQTRSARYARRRMPNRPPALISFTRHHPAGTVAMVAAVLLLFGLALTQIGIALIPLGAATLIIAAVAGLGGRGAKEREAYHRSGMTAIDAMTERQFEVLLEHFFANKGYRVARIGGRGELGADLLLNDAHGRMIVQARPLEWDRAPRGSATRRRCHGSLRGGPCARRHILGLLREGCDGGELQRGDTVEQSDLGVRVDGLPRWTAPIWREAALL